MVGREEGEDLEEQTITKIVCQGFRVEEKILCSVEAIASKKPTSRLIKQDSEIEILTVNNCIYGRNFEI